MPLHATTVQLENGQGRQGCAGGGQQDQRTNSITPFKITIKVA